MTVPSAASVKYSDLGRRPMICSSRGCRGHRPRSWPASASIVTAAAGPARRAPSTVESWSTRVPLGGSVPTTMPGCDVEARRRPSATAMSDSSASDLLRFVELRFATSGDRHQRAGARAEPPAGAGGERGEQEDERDQPPPLAPDRRFVAARRRVALSMSPTVVVGPGRASAAAPVVSSPESPRPLRGWCRSARCGRPGA